MNSLITITRGKKMKNTIDLHLHTTASDGKLSPEELVTLAKGEGLETIAVTDHDNTLGVDAALSTGRELKIKVIPGIELSTQYNGENIHILGYFRDESYKDVSFQTKLTSIREYRSYRGKKIIENLNKYFNIKLDYASVSKSAKGVIARPHIARAIIEAGYDYTWEYIFDRLIGSDSPAYVPNQELTSQDGLKLLHSVNALTVLAHPVLIKRTPLDELISMDFDGIEAIYFQNSQDETDYLIEKALSNKKIITAGSDFHGGDMGDSKHGYIGSITYPEEFYSTFMNRLMR